MISSSVKVLLRQKQRFIYQSPKFLNNQAQYFHQHRYFSQFSKDPKRLDEKVDNKFLLEENKSYLQSMVYFFTTTLRYAFFSPLFSSLKRMLGLSKPQQQKAWYQKIWMQEEEVKWYYKFNVFKNTKNKMIDRVVKVIGGLFFIYFFAKSIPNSIKNYKLRKQEIELETKRLEIEKLRLELEERKLKKGK